MQLISGHQSIAFIRFDCTINTKLSKAISMYLVSSFRFQDDDKDKSKKRKDSSSDESDRLVRPQQHYGLRQLWQWWGPEEEEKEAQKEGKKLISQYRNVYFYSS